MADNSMGLAAAALVLAAGKSGGGSGEPAQYIKNAVVEDDTLILTKKDGTEVEFTAPEGPEGPQGPQGEPGEDGSIVTVSSTGTSTDEVNYITIDGDEYKLAGGGSSDLPDAPDIQGEYVLSVTETEGGITSAEAGCTALCGITISDYSALADYILQSGEQLTELSGTWHMAGGTFEPIGVELPTVTLNEIGLFIGGPGTMGPPEDGMTITVSNIVWSAGETVVDWSTYSEPTVVTGTNDGTNWTSLTIDSDTYAIPAGGGSSDLPEAPEEEGQYVLNVDIQEAGISSVNISSDKGTDIRVFDYSLFTQYVSQASTQLTGFTLVAHMGEPISPDTSYWECIDADLPNAFFNLGPQGLTYQGMLTDGEVVTFSDIVWSSGGETIEWDSITLPTQYLTSASQSENTLYLYDNFGNTTSYTPQGGGSSDLPSIDGNPSGDYVLNHQQNWQIDSCDITNGTVTDYFALCMILSLTGVRSYDYVYTFVYNTDYDPQPWVLGDYGLTYTSTSDFGVSIDYEPQDGDTITITHCNWNMFESNSWNDVNYIAITRLVSAGQDGNTLTLNDNWGNQYQYTPSYTFTNGLTESDNVVSWDYANNFSKDSNSLNHINFGQQFIKINSTWDSNYGLLINGQSGGTHPHANIGIGSTDGYYGGIGIQEASGGIYYGGVDIIPWHKIDKPVNLGNASNKFTNGFFSGDVIANNIPAPPTSDGDYHLKCSIVDGVATYSWVSE